MTNNEKAFLNMIAISEGTYGKGDDGYNVLVGGKLFDGYSEHPNILVDLGHGLKSTAAGRYQLLYRYWVAYKQLLNLPDFSPESQDKIALQQIKERGALQDVNDGNIESAIHKCANIWASLPGNDYGQHQNSLTALVEAYNNMGGLSASSENSTETRA
ncbi:MAG TPA: glycoside hydrolase family 104 protein [Ferrovaceae bacterium]|nr:glycoside hydrolase family 104 protein [Ferrovaceae bacterium]